MKCFHCKFDIDPWEIYSDFYYCSQCDSSFPISNDYQLDGNNDNYVDNDSIDYPKSNNLYEMKVSISSISKGKPTEYKDYYFNSIIPEN